MGAVRSKYSSVKRTNGQIERDDSRTPISAVDGSSPTLPESLPESLTPSATPLTLADGKPLSRLIRPATTSAAAPGVSTTATGADGKGGFASIKMPAQHEADRCGAEAK